LPVTTTPFVGTFCKDLDDMSCLDVGVYVRRYDQDTQKGLSNDHCTNWRQRTDLRGSQQRTEARSHPGSGAPAHAVSSSCPGSCRNDRGAARPNPDHSNRHALTDARALWLWRRLP